MTFEITSTTLITGFGLHRQVLATVKRPSAAENKFAEHVGLQAGHFEAHADGEAVTVIPLPSPLPGALKSTAVVMVGTAEAIISIERKHQKGASA
jgi:hypothetical protein